jgi:ubiquinone/menaquinone biosynthesis C-methylase UbiE
MRDRLLNLPVMVALVLRLVYRKIAGLSEAVRVLKEEGLLWVKPLEVSKQAVSKRLMNLPCEIWRVLLKQVLEKSNLKPQNLKLEARWQRVSQKFSAIWIADGSTL